MTRAEAEKLTRDILDIVRRYYFSNDIDPAAPTMDVVVTDALLAASKPRELDDKHLYAFREKWEWQQGSQMLKKEDQGIDWRRTVAEFFWQEGVHWAASQNLVLRMPTSRILGESPVPYRDEVFKSNDGEGGE